MDKVFKVVRCYKDGTAEEIALHTSKEDAERTVAENTMKDEATLMHRYENAMAKYEDDAYEYHKYSPLATNMSLDEYIAFTGVKIATYRIDEVPVQG